MKTAIYTTRKLEKIIAKYISKNGIEENPFLAQWTANLLYKRVKLKDKG